MIGLRFFTGSKTYYFVTERSIGFRNLAKIEFLQGYGTQKVPQLESNSNKATKMNKNHDKLKSSGSQAEADFLIQEQWYRGGYQPSKRTKEEVQAGTIHDSEEGVNVPEVFRENRERFSSKPEDINAYRRQIKYRCGYIGTKELEIVLSDWLDMNA